MPVALRSPVARLVALVAALALGYTLLTALTDPARVSASTPLEGSVDATNTSATWSGGPFVVANVTGTVDDPDCSLPNVCDDYLLHVSTPAGYGTTHNLKISVSWANSAADFDVYMYDAAGNSVGTAASSADPEVIVTAPDTGDYTVRVVPYAPLGETYTASATLVDKPGGSTPSSTPAPPVEAFGAPESLPDSHNAGEPSIGVNWNTDATMFQSLFSTYKVLFSGTGTNTTASWTDASASLATGCPQGSTTSLDPILFTDHQTGRTFESQLSGENSLTCYTDDDGTTWSPSTGGGFLSGVDHQTIGGGPFTADNPVPSIGYPNAVYYCSQDIATAFCAVSRDGGVTFTDGTPTYNLTQCGGLHGHIQVAPDGTAYLPNKSCGANQAAVVSEDNGLTWDVRPVPASTSGDSDPAVGIGSNGTAYFGYVGADGVPRVSVSSDKGETWMRDSAVGTEFGTAGIQNAVFPAVVAGDDDRAAFAFLGTTTDGDYQAPNFPGIWHLYIAYTYDAGQSWSTRQVTPNDPVQAGSICVSGTTCGEDRNLLDFIGVTTDKEGFVEAAIADGCTGTCVTSHKNTDSRDAYATIGRQVGGLPLFSQFDPQPNLRADRTYAQVARSGSSQVKAVVTNTGTSAINGVRVAFRVNGTLLGVSSPVSVAPGQTVTVSQAWSTKKLKGTQQLLAIVDPANAIAESNETDNRSTGTVKLN